MELKRMQKMLTMLSDLTIKLNLKCGETVRYFSTIVCFNIKKRFSLNKIIHASTMCLDTTHIQMQFKSQNMFNLQMFFYKCSANLSFVFVGC